MKKKLLLAILSFGVLCLLAACKETPTSTPSKITSTQSDSKNVEKLEVVEVVSVMDGDTMKVNYKGKERKVRFLLIDAPEMYHKQLGEQPFGKEAQARNREILNNAKEVALEFDETGDKEDKYDRLLAYVYADGKSVQKQLIREGLVRVGYVYNKQALYLKGYENAQAEAQTAKRGIWQYEGYVTDRGFVTKSVPNWSPGQNPDKTGSLEENITSSTDTTNANETKKDAQKLETQACDIKGNINDKGTKTYFMPGHTNYEAVNEEEMFCTEQEAEKAGFNKAA